MKTSPLKLRSRTIPDTQVAVIGGKLVPRVLYERVKGHAANKVPFLRSATLYTLREIYGEEDWLALGSSWVRQTAGRCFAHMVAVGLFPLSFRQYKRTATKRYCLK